MSKAHYCRQMHSKRIRRSLKSLAKFKFWRNVGRSNVRLNLRGRPHGR